MLIGRANRKPWAGLSSRPFANSTFPVAQNSSVEKSPFQVASQNVVNRRKCEEGTFENTFSASEVMS